MKRVWHHFESWEEYRCGMWRDIPAKEREALLAIAIKFTGNYVAYGLAMRRVTTEWPVSCEHNLTDVDQNRKAWIGHAACCLATGCPEYVTRHAWGFLSGQQQDDANQMAHNAILLWEKLYAEKNPAAFEEVGRAGLRGGNTGRSSATVGTRKPRAVVSVNLPRDRAQRPAFGQPWLQPSEIWRLHGAETN